MTSLPRVPGTTIAKNMTNVRNLTSTFWKSMIARPAQRCLVPFSTFAEPRPGKDAETGRPPEYWFNVNAAPVAWFARIWRPSEAGDVFAFLTCGCEDDPANNILRRDPPPVILHPENTKFEGQPMRERYLPQARAVVAAIREPDEEVSGLPIVDVPRMRLGAQTDD